MTFESGMSGLQLRSLVKSNGELELSLVAIPTPKPGADEVVVRVEAAPISPTDIFLLLGAADLATLEASEAGGRAVVKAKIPAPVMKGMTGRLDQSLPVGSEGAGVVVEAGDSESARSLLGKKVAALGGAMYSQYRCLRAADCLVLHETATAADGASSFINPLTALGMVETMRREGHKALVHTAAASNLGQMLNKICIKDGIDLVNIVRDTKQEEILRGIGARHVYNSASPDFAEALTGALIATGATLAFERSAAARWPTRYSRRWRRRSRTAPKPTTATARTFISRSTFTAAWTRARSKSGGLSAPPGASAAGWCSPIWRSSAPRRCKGSSKGSSPNSPRLSRAITRARCRWPKRSMSR